MKRILSLITVGMFYVGTFAQSYVPTINATTILNYKKTGTLNYSQACKSDVKHHQMMLSDTAYKRKFLVNQQKVKEIINSPQLKSGGTYTIPVVVHVIHLGESVGTGTNISDAQIISAIDNMNDCFSGTGSYVNDMGIQFQLASQDPDCNATTGIVRIDGTSATGYSSYGISDGDCVGCTDNEVEVKALSNWPNDLYYNIWIVAEIDDNGAGGGTQGYAYFPGASAAKDGAVILYNSFGYDPTGSLGYNLKGYTNHNATANHEIGHGLSLYHTFQGDDSDNDGVADQCPDNTDPTSDGDACSDTDPHQRDDGNCGSTGNTCAGAGTDLADIVTNIMAYSSDECQVKFSLDQKDRMRATLEGARASLLSSKALQTPGDPFSPPSANSCTNQTDAGWGLAGFYAGISDVAIKDMLSSSSYPSIDNPSTGLLDETANCQKLITVDLEEVVDISVTTMFNGGNIKAYADYDNSGSFDVSEEIYSATGVAASTESAGTFTVPLTATTGTTLRLRVILDLNAISGPCHNPQYGQAEDYSIYVNSAGPAPTAAFSGTPTTICAGESVTFTDASTDGPTSWEWNFGDGGTSTAQNPSHTYNTAGTYTVQLSAINANGLDVETKTDYITVNPNPTLSGSSTGETCAGNDGTATVTPSGGSGSYNYLWDASASSQTNATATSLAAGTYNVVVSDQGTTCSNNTDVTVNNSCIPAPVADFTSSSTTICVGQSVTFTDASTNSPTSWSWDFGDAGSSTAQNIGHTYSSPGTYTVSLTATNAGGSDTETKLGYITVNATEDAGFSYAANTYCSSDSDPSPTVTGVGGGTFSSTTGLSINGGSGVIDLSASTAGTYTVTYTTPGTCAGSEDFVVTIDPCVPNTKVRADYCGVTLNYLTEPIYCDWVNGATDYEWEFTDPSNGVHTYVRLNGNQYVRLYYLGLDDLNTEYDVRVRAKVGGVWGVFSTSCTVSSPADYPIAYVSAADCGTTLASFDEFFECDVTYGADYYEWEFTDPSNNVTTYANTTGNRSMKLSLMGLTADNVEYDVRVRANFGGNWGPYGPSCTITSPAAGLTTKVRTADCGRVLTSFTERVFCDGIYGAVYYQWELTDPSNNVTVYTRLNGTKNFKLSYANLSALNTEYDVRVRAYLSGTGWTDYGAVCTLTSPSVAAFVINDEEDVELLSQAKSGLFADEEIVVIDNLSIASELIATAYPNPFKNNLTVDFEGNETEKDIKVYNSLGQVVRSINTSSSMLTIEMDELNQGVYIMQVIAGDEMKTIRLVKQ